MSEQHTQEIPGGWLPPAAPDPPARSPFGEPRRPWWKRAGSGLLATLILIGAKLKTLLLLLPKLKVLTTSGSMIVSVGAYALIWGWKFAIGFVVLLFIHEMGTSSRCAARASRRARRSSSPSWARSCGPSRWAATRWPRRASAWPGRSSAPSARPRACRSPPRRAATCGARWPSPASS
jgi:hypothetical protein